MNKIAALVDVLRKGSSVADPAVWKNRSALAIAIATFLAALVQLAKVFGYELPPEVNEDALVSVAGVIAFVVSMFLAYGTSDKVGLPPKPEAEPFPPLDQPDVHGGPEAP
jgi:hypothetical protein